MASSVDLLARNEIWWGSRLASMWSLMCWRTSSTKSFITTGVCAVGQISCGGEGEYIREEQCG